MLIAYLLPSLLSAFVVMMSLLAPCLEHLRLEMSQVLYAVLRSFCHQMPTRSFWIVGSPLGMCSRCLGLYVSFLLTSLFFVLLRQRRFLWKWGILLIVPILLDGITQNLGFRTSTNYLRFFTGILGGTGFAMLFLRPYWLTLRFCERMLKFRGYSPGQTMKSFFSRLKDTRSRERSS